MNVTFDPAKDAVNLAKHGFSLLDAVGFEWETAVVWPDTRRDYGGRLHGGECAYLRFMCRGRAENTPGGTARRCRETTV